MQKFSKYWMRLKLILVDIHLYILLILLNNLREKKSAFINLNLIRLSNKNTSLFRFGDLLWVDMSFLGVGELCCGTIRTEQGGWPRLYTSGPEYLLQKLLGTEAVRWHAVRSLSLGTDCCSLRWWGGVIITSSGMRWTESREKSRERAGQTPALDWTKRT